MTIFKNMYTISKMSNPPFQFEVPKKKKSQLLISDPPHLFAVCFWKWVKHGETYLNSEKSQQMHSDSYAESSKTWWLTQAQ